MEAVDDRAKRLTQVAETLQAIPQENRDILQQSSFGSRDYENEPGAQTRRSTKTLRSGKLTGLKLDGQ